jgi:quercetin dioxygenase-like cupin family protein
MRPQIPYGPQRHAGLIKIDSIENSPQILKPVLFFKEFDMRIVQISKVAKEVYVSPLFTGSDVTRQVLFPDSQEYKMNVVNFGRGVRNKFHAHDREQILIVTSGKGIIATEKEEKIITAGDIVMIPAGEKHWHGATPDSEFAHIFITRLGTELTQFEK